MGFTISLYIDNVFNSISISKKRKTSHDTEISYRNIDIVGRHCRVIPKCDSTVPGRNVSTASGRMSRRQQVVDGAKPGARSAVTQRWSDRGQCKHCRSSGKARGRVTAAAGFAGRPSNSLESPLGLHGDLLNKRGGRGGLGALYLDSGRGPRTCTRAVIYTSARLVVGRSYHPARRRSVTGVNRGRSNRESTRTTSRHVCSRTPWTNYNETQAQNRPPAAWCKTSEPAREITTSVGRKIVSRQLFENKKLLLD